MLVQQPPQNPYLSFTVCLHEFVECSMSFYFELDHRAILTSHLQVNVVVLRLHSFLQQQTAFDQPRITRTRAEKVSATLCAKLHGIVFPGFVVQPFCLRPLTHSAQSHRQTWATVSGDRTLI